MATIHQFTQYLFGQNHQANAARFAWFNFCKNHCEGTSLFDVENVNRFISRSLTHPYWQNNRLLLSEEVNSTLENFFYKRGSDIDRQTFDFKLVINAALTQIIPIEDPEELGKVIQRFLRVDMTRNQKIKVVNDGKKQAFAIKIIPDGSVQVQCFDNITIIKNGELVPLNQDQYLFYDHKLELSTRFVHHVPVAPFTTARFVVNSSNENRISGSLIKDHSFQKYDVFTAQLLKALPRIFYPIKRIEQYFINPKSEPHYQELQSHLERTLVLIKGNHPDSYNLGKNAIERGKMAMDSLYPSDKTLTCLIDDLETILNHLFGPKLEHIVNNTDGKRSLWENSNRQEKYGSTDILPTAESLAAEAPIN